MSLVIIYTFLFPSSSGRGKHIPTSSHGRAKQQIVFEKPHQSTRVLTVECHIFSLVEHNVADMATTELPRHAVGVATAARVVGASTAWC